MNPPPSPIAAIDASVVTPPPGFGRDRPAPRWGDAARRFLSRADVVLTGILILFGAAVLATFVIFMASLAVIAAMDFGARMLGASAHPALHVLSLVEFSAIGGLLLACVACAAFVADLRRQRWL